MTLRLRLRYDGEVQEFEFDRRAVSIGRGPLNDLVLGQDRMAKLHGTLELGDDGQLRLRCELTGCQTRVRRGDEELEADEQGASPCWVLRPGDVVRIDAEPQVELEIVDLAQEARRGEAILVDLPDDAAGPGGELAELWAEIAAEIAREPAPQSLLAGLAALIVATVGEAPVRLSSVQLLGENEFHRHVVAVTPASPASDHPGRLLEVEACRAVDPLRALGPAAVELRQGLESRRAAAFVSDRGRTQLWMGGSGEDRPGGFVVAELGAEVDEEERARLAEIASWMEPLSTLVFRHHALSREGRGLAEENRYFRERERRHYLFKELICESSRMREVYDALNERVGRDTPVLITGEAGTGKELLARALHHLGPRRDGLMISLNCGALTDELLDFELFGCAESELAGAVAPRKGIFELAHGGTVFLEEIDLLSPLMQGKIVRMLKEGEVRRIGDAVGRPVDARLIASIHRDLGEVVSGGRLRRDLYLLLNRESMEVPPLRERAADVLPLARIFLRQYARRYDKRCARFADEVIARLQGHDWPGNVRELQATVEAAVLKCEGEAVEAADLTL